MDERIEHILIAGGTGFLGGLLKDYFTQDGKLVRILSRSGKVDYQWDGATADACKEAVEWADVVINLSGKSVDCRYTKRNKAKILHSRLSSTKAIGEAITQSKLPPSIWLNASSATIYVHSESTPMTEDEGIIGDDFSMNVCKQWEEAFFGFQLNHTRKVALRTSIVLGNGGGAFPALRQLVKFRLGGYQGSGEQLISWIHAHDFCRAVDFCLQQQQIVGPVNITSPQPISNENFMQALRNHFGVNWGMNHPKWMLELGAAIVGTETELLLKSRNVFPERLVENEFEFKFEEIEHAFAELGQRLSLAY